MDVNNQTSVTEYEDCDQCGFPATKEIFLYTKEFTKTCPCCGKIVVKTLEETKETKGYGSLIENGVAKVFHAPISFVEEHEILKRIAENEEATFFKWSEEEQALIAVKGELPQTLEEMFQEQFSDLRDEHEYYESLGKINGSLEDEVPFNHHDRMVNIRPTGRIM